MRKRATAFMAGVLAVAALSIAAQAAPKKIAWQENYAKATAMDKKQGKPIFIDFYTEG